MARGARGCSGTAAGKSFFTGGGVRACQCHSSPRCAPGPGTPERTRRLGFAVEGTALLWRRSSHTPSYGSAIKPGHLPERAHFADSSTRRASFESVLLPRPFAAHLAAKMGGEQGSDGAQAGGAGAGAPVAAGDRAPERRLSRPDRKILSSPNKAAPTLSAGKVGAQTSGPTARHFLLWLWRMIEALDTVPRHQVE